MLRKITISLTFEIEGDGSFSEPFSVRPGADLRNYRYVLGALGMTSAFLEFGAGCKAHAKWDNDDIRWRVWAIDRIQLEEEEAATFLDEGYGSHFGVTSIERIDAE